MTETTFEYNIEGQFLPPLFALDYAPDYIHLDHRVQTLSTKRNQKHPSNQPDDALHCISWIIPDVEGMIQYGGLRVRPHRVHRVGWDGATLQKLFEDASMSFKRPNVDYNSARAQINNKHGPTNGLFVVIKRRDSVSDLSWSCLSTNHAKINQVMRAISFCCVLYNLMSFQTRSNALFLFKIPQLHLHVPDPTELD